MATEATTMQRMLIEDREERLAQLGRGWFAEVRRNNPVEESERKRSWFGGGDVIDVDSGDGGLFDMFFGAADDCGDTDMSCD